MLSYFRGYIPNFARVTYPLSQLLREGSDLRWTWRHDALVKRILDTVEAHEGLLIPKSDEPFVLEIDVGTDGYGGILLQEKEGSLLPIACTSKSMPIGKDDVPVEAVIRALVLCLRKFHDVLLCSPAVEVRTTFSGLASVLKKKNIGARL